MNQQTGPVNLKTPQHVGGNGRSLISRTPIWARVVVVLLLTLLASVTCVGTLYAASVSRMATDAQRVLTSAESLANSALGCGSDKSLSDISQELVNATNDLNAELNGPQWDFFRDHSRFGSDITAAREMLASVDTLVNGPFTDLLNLSKRLQGFSLKNGSVDVSALMDMPDIVKQAHKDISQQLTKLNKVPTPSVAKVATVLEAEKAALKTVDSMLGEYDGLINLLPQLLGEDGKRTELLNGPDSGSPLEAENPVFALFLEALGEQRCLAVDAVNGYENISVSQLPPLLDHGPLPKAGCFGYALLKDGAPCAVVSIRHLLNAILKKEGSHARA